MKRWALWVAFAAAIFGGTLSVFSTSQHIRIGREGLEEASFCAISDTINCDIVNASSYSEFLGVPIAWWGLCYYVALGGLALFAALSRRDRRSSAAAAWFMSCGGMAYSAFLAYVSFFVLEVLCVECMGMYLANILLFVFLFVALGVPLGNAFRFIRDYALAVFMRPSNLSFKPRVIPHAIAVGLVFLIGWLSISYVAAGDKPRRPSLNVDDRIKAFYMQSLHDISVDPGWSVWGNPDAKVTVVEFSEYQCPFCRISAFNVKPYLQEFKDDVRYYFVNYPLDSSCNDQMKRQMHPYACFSAKAAICADERGDFWGFHDDLFRIQRGINNEKILELAEERGWDRDDFLNCINSPAVDERLREEIREGQKIYVSGTPSFYLDGRKLRYWRDPKYLQALIREEISRTKKAGE